MARAALLMALLLVVGACVPGRQPPVAHTLEPLMTDDTITMQDGVTLPLRRWLPVGKPRAVILALHGFNDYSNAFAMPAESWARAGIATYAYDQRGFGAAPSAGYWVGDGELIEDLKTAAALLRARYPGTPFYLLGESMGGAVVMTAATGPEPPTADGYILVAPAVWGRETQGPLQSALLWLAAHLAPWMRFTGEGFNVHPSDNIEMLRAMARDPLVIKSTRLDAVYGLVGLMDKGYAAAERLHKPALVLYGSHEEVMPQEAVLAMLRRLPPEGNPSGPRIAVYPEGYHMLLRDLAAGVVHRDVVAWIEDRHAPLPSGADLLADRIVAGGGDSLALARDDSEGQQAESGAPAPAGP